MTSIHVNVCRSRIPNPDRQRHGYTPGVASITCTHTHMAGGMVTSPRGPRIMYGMVRLERISIFH
jgi:hypothetical protein